MAEIRDWPASCSSSGMAGKIARLFIIKNRFEAGAVIYALALGAIERGMHYQETYPGFPGWLLTAACLCAVFMAGARLLESVRPDNKERRRKTDYVAPPAMPDSGTPAVARR
jgi:hypothetical protein